MPVLFPVISAASGVNRNITSIMRTTPRIIHPCLLLIIIMLVMAPASALAQTNIDLGRKPKVEASKPDAAPQGSTLYTDAEQVRYQSYVTLAYKALLRDSLVQAAQYFQEAINLLPNHPSNAEAYYQLGQIALAQDAAALAAEQFQRSLRIAPTLTKSRRRLADACMLQSNYRSAIQNYNACLAQSPDDTTAIFLRGYAYQQTGSDTLALRDYQRVLSLNPLHADALMGKAVILHRQGIIQQAMEIMSNLITRYPQRAEYYATRAQMEQSDNRLDAALLDISRAITLEPSCANYLLLRADIYQRQGNTALSQSDRHRAHLLLEQPPTTSDHSLTTPQQSSTGSQQSPTDSK